jgi:putative ubiquitin-RnfH superfamily antitoxin RatB of RatAB toxin-antitoxin module
MDIFGAANLAQEVLQIVFLSEAGKLRNVVKSHINQRTNLGILKESEKRLGAFLRETDRVDVQRNLLG